MKSHNVVVLGSGLAALTCAARLTELGIENIALYAPAYGGTPYIAAINFVTPENPYGDTSETYCLDMLKAGYQIGNPDLVREMTDRNFEGYGLLTRWGVAFAKNPDGSTKLRHVSGHTNPRSLCCTKRLIGEEIVDAMIPRLKQKAVQFHPGWRAVGLLREADRISGVTVVDDNGAVKNVYAPVVVAAWGGVGNLYGLSTYPGDIQGDTLGIAHKVGADLIDIEFIEFEPMVVLDPPGAVGEPCPIAMLGEGGYLLNADGVRFLLEVRPEGEGGAPKTLINREIWKQVNAGKGSPRGGAYVDLRHIPKGVLQGYPWFYNRLMENGCDPNEQIVEVGPMAHSFSGGIRIDEGYESNITGLYAIGEACGGVHGACRCAGNAASQATMSALICADSTANNADLLYEPAEGGVEYKKDAQVYRKFVNAARAAAANAMGVYRNGTELASAIKALDELMIDSAIARDTDAQNTLCSMKLMLHAALARRESRGVHLRTDFPCMSDAFQYGIVVEKGENYDC